MIFGYYRVCTQDRQTDVFERACCPKRFIEKADGAKMNHHQLQMLPEQLRSGDTFMVIKLGRPGRSLQRLIDIAHELEEGGVDFVSVQDNINTSPATGTKLGSGSGTLVRHLHPRGASDDAKQLVR
ncbi:Transposon Tn917 resolvase [Fibrella aestuarina BUZ 2]|uniref:Transposon Tn917 resolvase n=1 Tax=Fibrella aestuarina BUZ 2 TaxID=1166018 RepID=I0K820_9BACT|nr:recombinase family protein [Fibrella aestuarina]CCH00273.1 Transposon Tn917 resolvase [Fibrella aestuarina BUZ 2]